MDMKISIYVFITNFSLVSSGYWHMQLQLSNVILAMLSTTANIKC